MLQELSHFYVSDTQNSKTFSYVFFISYLYLYQPAACHAKWTLSDRWKYVWNQNHIENKIDWPISCHLLLVNSLLPTIRLSDSIQMPQSLEIWNIIYETCGIILKQPLKRPKTFTSCSFGLICFRLSLVLPTLWLADKFIYFIKNY